MSTDLNLALPRIQLYLSQSPLGDSMSTDPRLSTPLYYLDTPLSATNSPRFHELAGRSGGNPKNGENSPPRHVSTNPKMGGKSRRSAVQQVKITVCGQ